MANQISALTESLRHTSARHDVHVDAEEGRIEIVAARDALRALFRRSLRFQVLLDERVVRYGGVGVPFDRVRPENLVVEEGPRTTAVRFRGHGIDTAVVSAPSGEQDRLRAFRERLWDLLSATDPTALATYGSDLTPTQWWLLGASAVFASATGTPPDKLEWRNPLTRRMTRRLLEEGWDVHSWQEAAALVAWLVEAGHRRDFTHAANAAALPPPARAEYERLLAAVGEHHERGDLPDIPETDTSETDALVRRLVFLRWGTAGGRAVDALDAMPHAGRVHLPGGDPLIGDVSWFSWSLRTGPNYWRAELHRVRQLTGRPPAEAADTRLSHDHAWALRLLRSSYGLGWIEAEECWERMLPIARAVQAAYSSWEEMAHCFLESYELWGGPDAPLLEGFAEAADELRASPRSPWRAVAWEHPLHRDW
ncbi:MULTISPECIES: DUF1266 domain-containing protein [unclassified Nocardiopsis]|uniref:DUF1266 domain-containing protein n=1 Tax=unclassified Nocardiopsis TaxID=2649073 RepID=UPI001358382C|nr:MULTISPECIES: DUF1266 domain-containing protein [unclassified Nocardiopsis]